MAGSLKDALKKSGLVPEEKLGPSPAKKSGEWLHELPEQDSAPHVPFEAPALTKTKDTRKPK